MKFSLYDVCECRHEFLQHKQGCSAIVPVGQEGYRGWVDPTIKSKNCSCKKFKYSIKNTSNILPSEEK